uniref:Fatty acyl-CoA reductase n=1 Tax=Aceria tosichella TaxID=561515 RepID=A0A6G1S2U3_9ACAR
MTTTTTSKAHPQPATGHQPRRVEAKVPNDCARQDDDSDDPFDIKEELKNAPRPRPGYTSNIVEFYKGRSVFITGASGFIGKVLIEKLLRTCPGIKRVFVLIRPKFNKQPHERLKELLNIHLFDGLREHGDEEQQKCIEQKVCLVEGDVTQANLGLNSYDLARIVQEVSVIFHSAATVKFDEPLKQSVSININGTKNMINLCRRIPQLAGLVHVSTAYANCDLETIDEHIYPVNMDPERLIEMADWLDQDTLQELKRRLLGAKPNTYTYTKSLAEWLLMRSGRDLPVVICRPSIVVTSASEPFKGWIDNMNGPTGVILGAGKGLVRSMFAETECVADLVPVDKVINLIVTLGWFANLSRLNQKKLLNGQANNGGRCTTKTTTTTGLDESLSDSLLISSSVCSSSAAGSSAASTSGMDDSLQDEELHSEHNDHHHHQQHEHLHLMEELCDQRDHHTRQIEHHREHSCSCSCNHLRRRSHRQSNRSADSHEEEEDANTNSSQEDDCADLSLTTSESSSSISNGGNVRSGGDRQNLCPLSEEEGLYSLQQAQSKQPTKSEEEEELHLSTIARDDGYASRSPEYANSVASESDSSSSAGAGKTGSSSSRRRAAGSRSCGGKLTEVSSGGAGASDMKILSISEMEQQREMGAENRPLNELCENNNESGQYDIMANHDYDDKEHHHNNNHSDHQQQEGVHGAVTNSSSSTLTDEEIAAKLRKLRARTVAKLNDKNLPEELADVPVFHFTSGGENPITWGEVGIFIMAALSVFPISDAYRYPCASFTNKPKLHMFYSVTLHYFPAYLVDLITRLIGGKPVLVKIFKKFDQAVSVLKTFTSNQWKFDYDNRLFLMQELMNEEDRRLFDCDVKEIDWRQFLDDYVIGVRKFLCKEPMSRLAEARRRLRFVYYRNLCLQLVAATIGAYCASSWMGLLDWRTS